MTTNLVGATTQGAQKDYRVQDLKAAFEARKDFFANRSSCIFPLFLSASCDLHIVFLNYWTLKNDIAATDLVVNLRIFSASGQLAGRHSIRALRHHNQFSIKELLQKDGITPEQLPSGMVEVEVISTANLRFSFPGVTAIYQSGNLYSAVHAAGRIKNPDEPQALSYTRESNWSCKFAPGITPFFHYFVGPSLPQDKTLQVCLHDPRGEVVAQQDVSIADMKPFSSRVFLADELFDTSHVVAGSFLSVRVEHNSVFPRLVVGNYFRELDFHEVTHSFPVIEKNDYCPAVTDAAFQSMLCAYTEPELNLDLTVFPTNCNGSFDADFRGQKEGRLTDKGDTRRYSTSVSSDSIRLRLEDDETFLCLQMRGDTVPSRFNASFQYRVKGSDAPFSTDIASGAKSCVYPPKHRHWGHGCVAEGFDSVILIRNNSHRPQQTIDATGQLSLYADGMEKHIDVRIPAESALSLRLSDLVGSTTDSNRPAFISWILEMDVPNAETFWVAYRKTDGAVFGEHGF